MIVATIINRALLFMLPAEMKPINCRFPQFKLIKHRGQRHEARF